ncbi:MAG: hypothetical protein AB7F67_26375 [Rhodospirillaceae bacterium]
MTRLRRLAVLVVAALFAVSMTLSGATLPFALAAAAPDGAHHAAATDAASPCHGDHRTADDRESQDADHAAPGLSCCGVACHTAVPVNLVFAPPEPLYLRAEPAAAATPPPAPPLRIEHPPKSAGFFAG